MIFANALRRFLATGEKEAAVEDSAPKGSAVDLKAHDLRFHGGRYDGKGACKYREALAKGDGFDRIEEAEKEEAGENAATAPTPQDYRDLHRIRDRIEPLARLLNGRHGNLAAIKASSRWPRLMDYISQFYISEDGKNATQLMRDDCRLAALQRLTDDPSLVKGAQAMRDVIDNIVKSSTKWDRPVGMVPSAADLPPIPGSAKPQSTKPPHHSPGGGGRKGPLSGIALTPFMSPSPWAGAIAAINQGHPAAADADWFKKAADALTPAQAVSMMEANGDIVKGGYRDAINPGDPDEHELWAGWKPSTRLSEDTVRCAAICFRDLKTRFPNIDWKKNLELRCGTKPLTGGQSTHTHDWRRHTVLFNCDYGNIWRGTGLGKSNYGHPDARFPFDVLRHELGHALMSDKLPNGKRKMSIWHQVLNDNWGDDAKELWRFAERYVSTYAVTDKGNGPSAAECLSECFSLATSPDYRPGYLPAPIEDFIFGKMLGLTKPTV